MKSQVRILLRPPERRGVRGGVGSISWHLDRGSVGGGSRKAPVMRVRPRAVLCMGLLVLAGCAAGPRSSSDPCRSDHISTRRGGFDKKRGFNWTSWDMGDRANSDGRLDVVESIEHCQHFVTVTQGGREWRSRGYR